MSVSRLSISNLSPVVACLCATALFALAAGPSFAAAGPFATPSVSGAGGGAPAASATGKTTPSVSVPQGKLGAAAAAKLAAAAKNGAKGKGALPNIKLPSNILNQTTPTSATSSSSSSGTLMIFALICAVALLVGIAYMILRDARSMAPVGDGPIGAGAAGNSAAKLRKRRAKAKAARRQRKRNR